MLGLGFGFVGLKPLNVLVGEGPKDLLFYLEFRDFVIVPSPPEEGVDTGKPRIDRDRSNSPFPQGHDSLVDGLFGVQSPVEDFEHLVVPC